MTNSTSLLTWIRYCGIGLIVLSVFSYLIKGLSSFDDFGRFMVFGGLAVSMVGLGIFSLNKLSDKLTAKIFMVLGLTAVPALSALYGSVLYSAFGVNVYTKIPGFYKWSVSTNIEVLICGVVLLLIGLINSSFGFKVLNRDNLRVLMPLFIINNILLIVPARVSLMLWIYAVIILLQLFYLERKAIFKIKSKTEFLGLFATFLPVLILFGRAAYYTYNNTIIIFILSVLASLFMYFSYINLKSKIYLVSAAICLCLSVISGVILINNNIYSFTQPVLVGMLVFTFCLQILNKVTKVTIEYKSTPELLSFIWSFGFVAFFIYTRFISEYWIHLVYIASGIYITYLGTQFKHKWLFSSGALFSASMIVGLIWIAIHDYLTFNWLSVALLGVVILIAASLLEKKGTKLKVKYNQLFAASSSNSLGGQD